MWTIAAARDRRGPAAALVLGLSALALLGGCAGLPNAGQGPASTALPADATGFTTVELKTNYLGTARSGVVTATAVRMHGGRRTQIWDATVRDDQGSTIALFRCTQLIFHP